MGQGARRSVRRAAPVVVAALAAFGLTSCVPPPGDPVDVGVGGAAPNGASETAVISDNGRYVAFVSRASNLVTSDTNGVADVFVRDRSAGTTQRVSVTSSNGQLNRASGGSVGCYRGSEGDAISCGYGASTDTRSLAISDDGRYVAFLSAATNVVGPVARPQVYVKDRSTGALRLASRSATGSPADGYSFALELSGDGGTLAFWSAAGNLDGPGAPFSGVFAYDTSGTGSPRRLSDGSDCFSDFISECLLFAHDYAPSMTDDGARIEFTSRFFNAYPDSPDRLRPLVSGGGRYLSYQWVSYDFPGGHTAVMIDHGRYVHDAVTGRTSEVVPGNVEAAAKDVSGDGGLIVSVTDRVRVRPAGRVLQMRYRVNAGGSAYTGPMGAWQADTGFSGGSVYVTDQDVGDPAGDPRVYRSERWGMTGYRLAVPNGRYRVRLHFAEISPCCPDIGDRVFDVRLEGALVLDDFDINEAIGSNEGGPIGPFHALEREFVTTVQDGYVDLGFSRVVQMPKLSGIEIMDAA